MQYQKPRGRIRAWHVVVISAVFAAAYGFAYIATHQEPSAPVSTAPQSQCDPTLWQHVYHGRFNTPQDRLTIINDCITVTGIIVNARREPDGDYHIRLDVDDKTLLDDGNINRQQGYLVLEPVCENPVSQKDVLEEGVCDGFSQNIFDPSMVGERVSVSGAYVEDEEHHWREIHPVTSIRLIP